MIKRYYSYKSKKISLVIFLMLAISRGLFYIIKWDCQLIKIKGGGNDLQNKYSLYHVINYNNNVSLRTVNKLVEDGLTVHDFVENTPKLNVKIGNKKSIVEKISKAISLIPPEQFNKPCLYHLNVTGLSQHNILLLKSSHITYQDLKDLSLSDFITITSSDRVSTYERIIEAYKAFELLYNHSLKTEILETAYIDTSVLIENYINSLEPGTFFSVNQLLEAIPLISEENVMVFLKKNLLLNKGLWYRKKYKKLEYHLNNQASTKNMDVLISRIVENKTLQELANSLNITRQAISLREKSALKSFPVTEEEILYKEFFENFSCSKQLFCELFNVNEIVYNFLTLRLKKGKKNILDHLSDFQFSEAQKKIILNHFNGIINHKNDLSNLSKISVFEDVLFYYGKISTNDTELFPKFNEYIIKNNYDLELAENPNALRGLSERCQYALRDRGHNYRYYDFSQLTDEEVNRLKELLNLPNGIYNMKRIYNDYIDFMKSIDIKNENELHNLYKTFIPMPNITYNRMPEFAVGNIEKNEFLIHLFHEQAPIHIDEFVNFVNENYFLKNTSLKSHIQMFLSEYVSEDIIRVKYEDVSVEEIAYLKSILTREIHTVDEIVEKGNQKYNDFHDKFINNMVLKQLDYSIRSGFILSNAYSRVERYFIKEILKNDYFINNRLPVNRTQIFWKVIYDLEKNLDLLKVEKNMYITAEKLNQSGVPKSLIIDFQNKVTQFVGNEKYFTVSQIQKQGFMHKLFDLGFDSIFYDRILWADPRIKAITLDAGYIFIIQNDDVSFVDFLQWLINEFEVIEGFDLINYINEKYRVSIELQKAVTLLQSTEIYYSPELSKFYCDKNTFFEEIYK
ncbi:hypothetical protein ACFWM3_19260 [Gottfriedia sp. NPDC058432]|uniref:hypothetical protein n=1 Tax=Gottfriedia sp. NPDC058432 TaxID=3346497 RepID=UPI003645FFFF